MLNSMVAQAKLMQDYWMMTYWKSLKGLTQCIWKNGWKLLINTRLMWNLGIIMHFICSLFYQSLSAKLQCLDHEPLSISDYQHIKMFDVLIHSDLSGKTYNLIQTRFNQELQMKSLYRVHSQIAKLSHVIENSYDCCTNSCCCFVTHFASLDACPYCKQPHFKSDGQTLLRTFHYLPIGP